MLLNTIEEINRLIENEWRYVNQVINAESIEGQHIASELFDEYASFESAPERGTPEANKIWGRHGVYIFLFRDDIQLTYDEVLAFNNLKGAKIKEENISQNGAAFWGKMCLYTGSCIKKSLYSRLREHFGNTCGSSLHLGANERRCIQTKVIAYAFPIKREFEEYLRIITPGLEHQMHIHFNAMAGSPRV